MRILLLSGVLLATASCAWTPPPAELAAPPPMPAPIALVAPSPPAVVAPAPPPPPPVAVAAPAPFPFMPFAGFFGPPRPGRLTLSNFTFDNAHVEAVITGAPDCAVREGTATSDFVLPLNGTRIIEAVPGADICWRRAVDARSARERPRQRPAGPSGTGSSCRPGARSIRSCEPPAMTRIASIATYPISVPRSLPVWTAQEESKAWSVILTEVKTDDGLVGYGEIHGAPMPRICEWVARFAEIIRGMDALAHEAVWDKLFALTCPRPGAIPGAVGGRDDIPPPVPRGERTQVMAAIAGIDIALWDLKGKAAGMPVWRLLGGENRPLFTYATGGYYRPGPPMPITARSWRGFSISAIARSSSRPAPAASRPRRRGSARCAPRWATPTCCST